MMWNHSLPATLGTLRTILACAAIIIQTSPLAAQSAATQPAVAPTQDMALSDALARAMEKNRDLVIERESATLADAGIERAQGAYDPTFRADVRYQDRQTPVTSLLNGAPPGDLAPRQDGFTSSASFAELLRSGASVTFSTSVGRTSDNSFITHGVEQAYWTLVAAQRNIDIQQQNIGLAEQQRSDVSTRIEAKTAPESDIAQPTAEIARRRGELYAAEEARLRAEQSLKLLMLEGPSDPLWNVPLRASDAPDIAPSPIDLAAALADAQKNRPELADITARVQLQDIEIDAARDRLKPQFDVVANYTSRGLAGSLNDFAKPIIPGIPLVVSDATSGGLNQSLWNLTRQRFPDASVGVSLTVPIGNRVAKADLATAEITKKQTLTQQDREAQRIASEVRNAAVALQTAAQRMDAARAQREAAEVQLRAEQDRFTAGLTTTFLVLTRQNDLANAQQNEISALTTYRRALAELSRARGTLLRDRSIEVK
jgi:outer membrane protein